MARLFFERNSTKSIMKWSSLKRRRKISHYKLSPFIFPRLATRAKCRCVAPCLQIFIIHAQKLHCVPICAVKRRKIQHRRSSSDGKYSVMNSSIVCIKLKKFHNSTRSALMLETLTERPTDKHTQQKHNITKL